MRHEAFRRVCSLALGNPKRPTKRNVEFTFLLVGSGVLKSKGIVRNFDDHVFAFDSSAALTAVAQWLFDEEVARAVP